MKQHPKDVSIPVLNPPAHLSDRAQAIWREVAPARAKSAARLALLQTALEALDRATEAREIIDAEGLVVCGARSKMPHAHPAASVEAVARRQFLRAWEQLSLAWTPSIDGRTS